MQTAHLPSSHPYVTAVDPAARTRADDWNVGELLASGADVVHVHFGFEHFAPDSLDRWITRVQRAGRAIVHTVHDIDNPHLVDQRAHHRRTELLASRSDAVTTLTAEAADVVRRRWNPVVEVIAHPPLARGSVAAGDRRGRPLLWLGTLRPNIDVTAVEAIVSTPDAGVDVAIRREGWDSADTSLRICLEEAQLAGRIRLDVIRRPTDDELANIIGSSEVLLLPYAWGTHSGLVELAAARGVHTVTTPTGCRGGQGAIESEPDAMLAVARRIVAEGTTATSSTSLQSVRRAHRSLYASVLAGRQS